MKTSEPVGYSLKVQRGERPFVYSEQYRDWRAAVKRGDERATEEADTAWRKRFRT